MLIRVVRQASGLSHTSARSRGGAKDGKSSLAHQMPPPRARCHAKCFHLLPALISRQSQVEDSVWTRFTDEKVK